jgi:hypothetical protein
MSAENYTSMARKHWTKWLPQRVARLNADGQLEQALQTAGKLAQERVLELMPQGYQQHEAEEVALSEYILLSPESSATQPAWERAELAALEDLYQRAMRDADD